MNRQLNLMGWARKTFGTNSDILLGTNHMRSIGLNPSGLYDGNSTYNRFDTVYDQYHQWWVALQTVGEVTPVEGEFWTSLSNYKTLPLMGGVMSPNAAIGFSNGTSIQRGSFDNELGGSQGISLFCAINYELNWQAGHLSNFYNGYVPIILDSDLQFNNSTIIRDSNGGSSINPTRRLLTIPGQTDPVLAWDSSATSNVDSALYWFDFNNGGRLTGDGSGLSNINISSPSVAYISQAGNDTTGNGSIGRPYATIQRAYDNEFANYVLGTGNFGTLTVNGSTTIYIEGAGNDNSGQSSYIDYINVNGNNNLFIKDVKGKSVLINTIKMGADNSTDSGMLRLYDVSAGIVVSSGANSSSGNHGPTGGSSGFNGGNIELFGACDINTINADGGAGTSRDISPVLVITVNVEHSANENIVLETTLGSQKYNFDPSGDGIVIGSATGTPATDATTLTNAIITFGEDIGITATDIGNGTIQVYSNTLVGSTQYINWTSSSPALIANGDISGSVPGTTYYGSGGNAGNISIIGPTRINSSISAQGGSNQFGDDNLEQATVPGNPGTFSARQGAEIPSPQIGSNVPAVIDCIVDNQLIAGDITSSGILTITGVGTQNGYGMYQQEIASSSSEVGISLRNTGTNGRKYNIFSTNESSGIGAGKFAIGDETASAGRLIIDQNGNVGINQISPDHTLEVRGDIYGALLIGQNQTGSGNALEIHSASNYGTLVASIDADGLISNLSGDSDKWSSTYSTVHANSADWNYQGTDVKALTSAWDNAYTTVNSQSANNASVYTTVNAQSANNASVYTTVNAQSANNASVYTTVNSNSATTWNYQGTDVKALTSVWNSTYTTVNAQSANNASVYTTVNAQSANNASVYTTVNSNSATWNGAITTAGTNLNKSSTTINLNTALTGIQSMYLSAGLNPSLSAITLDAGTLTTTTSNPVIVKQIWNNASLAGPALKVDITDTSSSSTAMGVSMYVNNTLMAGFNKAGDLYTGGAKSVYYSGSIMNFVGSLGYTTQLSNGPNIMGYIYPGFSSLAGALHSDGVGNIAQHGYYSPTTAQSFTIYNTYTSATNHERLNIGWRASTGSCVIGTEKGTGGGSTKDLLIQTDGSTRMTFTSAGNISLSSALITNSLITGNGGFTSADWDSTRTTVNTNSAAWNAAAFTWNTTAGTTQTLAVNNGYIGNNASLITFTLPSTAAVGAVIHVASNKGGGQWKIAQNAGQNIQFGSTSSTVGTGGSLASINTYDTVKLLCITANTTFLVTDVVGNLTIT